MPVPASTITRPRQPSYGLPIIIVKSKEAKPIKNS